MEIEVTVCESGRRFPSDAESTGALLLDFIVSRTVKEKFLLFVNYFPYFSRSLYCLTIPIDSSRELGYN